MHSFDKYATVCTMYMCNYVYTLLQWNLSNVDTLHKEESVLISELSFQVHNHGIWEDSWVSYCQCLLGILLLQ